MTIILKKAGCEDAELIWKMQVRDPAFPADKK